MIIGPNAPERMMSPAITNATMDAIRGNLFKGGIVKRLYLSGSRSRAEELSMLFDAQRRRRPPWKDPVRQITDSGWEKE